jgi:hypothetical protein
VLKEVSMIKPISPPAVTSAGQRELPAYVSNGLIGLRVRDIAFLPGMSLLNGYAGEHPEKRIEAAAATPYPLAADVAVDGVWLSDCPHQAKNLRQSYDFETGELFRVLIATPRRHGDFGDVLVSLMFTALDRSAHRTCGPSFAIASDPSSRLRGLVGAISAIRRLWSIAQRLCALRDQP